jgi:hypothetical protein
LPTARREYRTPLSGRVEPLVTEYQKVEVGTPLYRVESSGLRDLHEQIAAARARLDSMGPIREAHRVHERSLADKVQLWKDRLAQLDELRGAGGGSGSLVTEARATLNATQAELADVMEQDAELQAQQKTLEAEVRSLDARRGLLVASSGSPDTSSTGAYEVRAIAPGIVESISITPGGLAAESDLIVTVVQPEKVRFRARGLQADMGRLRDGLASRIVPPRGVGSGAQDALTGTLTLGLAADPDERTVDLIVQPEAPSAWARAGVSASLEIVLEGGMEELAVPSSTITRDGAKPIIFRRDPKNPDKVIRMEADLGIDDGNWVVVKSGVAEGDEIVLDGVYQLMLATAGNVSKGGHFHPDGTFHEGED